MNADAARLPSSLAIVHVLRAPIGGLFRHVADLVREQVRRGHRVGLVVDSTSGGAYSDALLADLEPSLELGLFRLPMSRNPSPRDLINTFLIARHCAHLQPDVIHGHGSKGGLYARGTCLWRSRKPVIRAYTPHGGSLNYAPGTVINSVYMAVEAALARATDLFLFESAYARDVFSKRVKKPDERTRVALNGLASAEFEPVTPAPDAADFMYVGELRQAKGVDLLIHALMGFRARTGRDASLVLVGSGPDTAELEALVARCNLQQHVTMVGPRKVREAFALGKTLIVPSRRESLPYIVLEAAAAQAPIISTDAGGIGEIFGPYSNRLIPTDDLQALADALALESAKPDEQRRQEAAELASFVASKFTIPQMVDAVISGYAEARARKLKQTVEPAPLNLGPSAS